MSKKTNKEMLIYGINHIAENHGFIAVTEDWEETRQVAIMGNNVPTLADIQSLCADLGISRENIYKTIFGIDIEIPYDWFKKKANKKFNGLRYWERVGAK